MESLHNVSTLRSDGIASQCIHTQCMHVSSLALRRGRYMHSANLVHRDMKPSNLLLNSECLMKVADFGLARSLNDNDSDSAAGHQDPNMTDYVATRWYRAPEILLGSHKYGISVDLWSLGCIFGEMLGGKPLFPGTSTLNQLEKVGEMIGAPTKSDIKALNSQFTLEMLDGMPFPMGEKGVDGKHALKNFQRSEPPEEGCGGGRAGGWHTLYPNASNDALDMLTKLMLYNSEKRITAKEGLVHPYCSQVRSCDAQARDE